MKSFPKKFNAFHIKKSLHLFGKWLLLNKSDNMRHLTRSAVFLFFTKEKGTPSKTVNTGFMDGFMTQLSAIHIEAQWIHYEAAHEKQLQTRCA